MRLKLFPKFVIVILLVSLIPISILGYRLINIGQLGVKTAILELHLAMADGVAGEFDAYLDRIDGRLRFLSDAMGKMDWDGKQSLLASFADTMDELREISVLSKEGKEVIKVLSRFSRDSGELRSYAKDQDYISVGKSGKKIFSLRPSSTGKDLVVFFPFTKDLVLHVVVDVEKLAVTQDLKKIAQTGFPVVIDRNGSPVAYPKDIDVAVLKDIKDWPITKAALGALAAGSSEYDDASGAPKIGAYVPLAGFGGAVMVTQSREEAYRYALFMRRQALYVVVFFVVAAFFFAYVLSKQLTGPIMELTKVADKVADGDFSKTVNVTSGDELKDLAETFNKMVRQLRAYSDMQVDRIIREQKNTEAVLFSTEDGIVMIDDSRCIQLMNRKARSVLGLGATDAVDGRKLLDIIAAAGMKEVVIDVLESQKENYFREIEVSLEHSSRYFRCFCSPIIAPEKKTHLGTLVAFYDVTLAHELERIKDEFLHSITHDLRNPMGAIKGFVEFLLKEIPGPINDGQRKMLSSIDRATFRLLGMINNILDIAKMEAGKMELKLSTVNVSETAKRVLDLLEPLGQRKRIKFVLAAPENVMLDSDQGLMERMFTNLVGNAIKFTHEDGEITVRVSEDDKNVRMAVEDNGDGIPIEYLDKIFEKFEQVKGQKAGGTGLGLTICKHIVGSHRGRIWVESDLGKGAKFIFEVPKGLGKDESGKVIVREAV